MALAVTTVLAQRAPPEREIESGWSFLLKRGETAWPSRWLGCATWSVLDSSERTFETLRLAIAKGDRSARALHPRKSQVTTIRLMRGMETRRGGAFAQRVRPG